MEVKTFSKTPTFKSIRFWIDTLINLGALQFPYAASICQDMCVTMLTMLAMNKKELLKAFGYSEGYGSERIMQLVKNAALFAYAGLNGQTTSPYMSMPFDQANLAARVDLCRRNPNMALDISPVLANFRRPAKALRIDMKSEGTYDAEATAILHDLAIAAFPYLYSDLTTAFYYVADVGCTDKMEVWVHKVVNAKDARTIWATDYFMNKYHKAVKKIYKDYLERVG